MRRRSRKCFAQLVHLRRKRRLAGGDATPRDGPLFEPAVAMFADVGIRKAVSVVAESGLKGDETITSLAKQVEELADVLGFEIVAVEQNDLSRLVAEEVARELFFVFEDRIGMSKKRGDDFLL